MKRIMVGVDGSSAGSAALRWGGALARAAGTELTAVHAYRRPYAEIPSSEHARMLEERREIVGRWLQPVVEAGTRARFDVIEGDPRLVLTHAADRDESELLVLGRTGRSGGPGFLHLGSVVEHVAHDTQRPLAVIPSDAPGAITRVVLGVDGSPASAAAVEWCAEVAGAVAAEVVAVTVEEPIAEWTPNWDERNWRRDAERSLHAWATPLAEAHVAVETIPAEHLYPADGLLGVAAARGADLLVIGTRGAGGFLGLRFGGLAMKVLHRASLPLVLVPPALEV